MKARRQTSKKKKKVQFEYTNNYTFDRESLSQIYSIDFFSIFSKTCPRKCAKIQNVFNYFRL